VGGRVKVCVCVFACMCGWVVGLMCVFVHVCVGGWVGGWVDVCVCVNG